MRQARCRSCGAAIAWVRMGHTGKHNPLNPAEDFERGNVLIIADQEEAARYDAPVNSGVALGPPAAAAIRETGRGLYLSHFATCPNRAQHRKR